MSIEQLRELLERLNTDPASVTAEGLGQARAFIREQRDHFAQQEASDDVLAGLEELAGAFRTVRQVQEERATVAAELDERRRGLLEEITDESSPAAQPIDGSDDAGPAVGAPAATTTTTEPPPEQPTEVTTEPNGEPTGDAEASAVAASARPARRAPIGAFRTSSQNQPPRQDERLTARTVVTAAGGQPSFTQGQEISNTAQLALAMTERIKAMSTGRAAGGGEKIYVAHARTEYPEARTLKAADWVGNFSKIEGVTAADALVAAGGLCTPLQPLYDVEVIGSQQRPVRDALARFGVDRGGIQFRPPTSAAAALMDAVSVWSVEQDAAQGDTGDTKPCYEVVCPAVEEAMIYAVPLCLEFSNITARFDPESTAANLQQGMIAHARKAENELLRAIQLESKVFSSPKVIGAVRDLLANIDKASAYYRNRHRIDTEISLTCIMPAWVRYMIRTDVARQMAAGDWMEALGLADARIDLFFRNRSVNPVWHLDGDVGGTSEVQTITVTGGPTGGSYTLTFSGQTTAAIPWNATAANVRDALADLSNIRYTDITVAGGPHPATAITVQFAGQYEMDDVAQMTDNDAGLTGGASPAVTVTTTTTASTTSTVNGVTIASQVYAEAAAGAVLPGYPNQVDALLFTTGSILFLDGGSLDLGLVRDSTLNSRNRYRQFSETFEGIANRAVEPLRLAMTVQPTGQTAGTKDTDAIAD